MTTFPLKTLYNWYRELVANPKYRWWVVAASILYLVSPIDISPDIFPIVGWIDDGIVISLLIAEVAQIAKDKLQESNVRAANATEKTDDEGYYDGGIDQEISWSGAGNC